MCHQANLNIANHSHLGKLSETSRLEFVHHANCDMILYIFPPDCSAWYLRSAKETMWTDVVPAQDIIFCQRIHRINFYIQVGLIAQSRPNIWQQEFTYLVDNKVTINGNRGRITPPTKFLIAISHSNGEFQVSSLIRLESLAAARLLDYVTRKHALFRKRSIYAIEYIRYEAARIPVPRTNIALNLLPHLNLLRIQQPLKKRILFNLVCVHCIRHTNSKVEPWRDDRFLDASLLNILCPNCTKHLAQDGLVLLDGFPSITVQLDYNDGFTSPYLTFEEKGLYFLTCVRPPQTGHYSLVEYVNAFNKLTWAGLLIAIVFTFPVLLLSLNSRTTKFNGLGRTNKMSAIFLPCQILLEQGTPYMPMTTGNTILIGSWFLSGVVLVNSYKGDNIQKLSKVLPKNRLDTFDELLENNVTIYGSNLLQQDVEIHADEWNRSIELGYGDKFVLRAQKSRVSPGGKKFHTTTLYISTIEFGLCITQELHGIIEKAAQLINLIKIPSSFNEAVEMLKPGYMLDRLGNCVNEAFVGNYRSVVNMYVEMKSEWKQKWDKQVDSKYDPFYVSLSKEAFVKQRRVWVMEWIPWNWEVLQRGILGIVESGLSGKWEDWLNENVTRPGKVDDARNMGKVESLTLKGNTIVTFFIYMVFIGACLFTFGLEITNILCFPSYPSPLHA